jgi:hypothetical protein
MKRNTSDIAKNYVRRLSDHDLDFLRSRLIERLQGDLANLLEFLQKSPEVDRLLSGAPDVDSFYEVVDAISDAVLSECGRRFSFIGAHSR